MKSELCGIMEKLFQERNVAVKIAVKVAVIFQHRETTIKVPFTSTVLGVEAKISETNISKTQTISSSRYHQV